jgi:hypothetical protein
VVDGAKLLCRAVPTGEKAPKVEAWQQLRLNYDALPQYFNSTGQIIGVLLGEPYGRKSVEVRLNHAQKLSPIMTLNAVLAT